MKPAPMHNPIVKTPGWLAVLTLSGLSLLPRAALACGVCIDRSMSDAYWWIHGLLGLLVVGFLVTHVIYRVVCAKMGVSPDGAILRWWMILILIVAGVVSYPLAGPLFLYVVVNLAFLADVVASCIRARIEPKIHMTRIGLILLAPLITLIVVHPSNRSTRNLVERAAKHHVAFYETWPKELHGWAEQDLAQRPDAIARIEHELDQTTDKERATLAALVRIHYLLKGDPSKRAPKCRALLAKGNNPICIHHCIQMPGLEEICGTQSAARSSR